MIVKNVEKKENNTATFQVESDKAEFETAVNKAYLKNKHDIYIPGFRKGKAPRAVVEGMYGAEVFYQDAIDDMAGGAFEFGLKESGLKIVGTPSISDLKVTDERTVEYTFSVSLYPEVTLGEYKGLEAEKDEVKVSDESVENELQSVRRRDARMITVEDRAAQMGDTVKIDFDGYLDGKPFEGGKASDYPLELGSNSFVPGFEEQVVGMKLNEEKDLNITFPEDYVENLAGKDVVFKVKLNAISFPELPELDDEFAKDVSEFDTLDEYRADIRKKQEENMQNQADSKFHAEILKKACDNMTVDIPEVMISEKTEEIIRNYAANFGMTDRSVPMEKLTQMMGLDDEAIKNNVRPAAEFQVKSDLLLDAVVKAEKIEPTDEDCEEYVKKISESVNSKPEDIVKYFGMEYIKEEYSREKASNIIYDSAVVAEAKPVKKTRAKKAKPAEDSAASAEADSEKAEAKPKAKKTTKAKAEKAEEPAKADKTESDAEAKPKTTRKKAAPKAKKTEEKAEEKAE
ncbi:MAG: trigger factor [Candidatus Limivicinus sp.]|jgi:trigger factor